MAGIEADLKEYFQQACPSESLLHACYFHKSRNRLQTKSLEYRLYFPTNPTCDQFNPTLFLDTIRHRRIIMIGDSVMSQIFNSLLCSLYKVVTTATYGLHFERLWRDNCTPTTCPFNQANHSHLDGGWINFPLFNASIIHFSLFNYHFVALKDLLDDLAVPLTSHDIVIHNFGLHYDNETDNQRVMNTFAYDIVKFLNDETPSNLKPKPKPKLNPNPNKNHPKSTTKSVSNHGGANWFFLDTVPQHFSTPLNGYYSKHMQRPAVCEATINFTEKFIHDWRNRIAEKALSNIHSRFHYVPMALALYDQYDAHVGVNLLRFSTVDCTHWCYPSNIFRYLHMIVLNMIRKRINHILPLNSKTNPKHPQGHVRDEVPYMLPPKMKDGMLIKSPNNPSIYLIQNGKLREFQSITAFVKRGFDLSQVIEFLPQEFSTIPPGKNLK
jgi:hypothetical protein